MNFTYQNDCVKIKTTKNKENERMPKRLLVKVNEADNVAIAVQEIKAGTQVAEDLVANQDIPQAHKIALEKIPKGKPVIRYGVILGYAMNDIEKGDWINEFIERI